MIRDYVVDIYTYAKFQIQDGGLTPSWKSFFLHISAILFD